MAAAVVAALFESVWRETERQRETNNNGWLGVIGKRTRFASRSVPICFVSISFVCLLFPVGTTVAKVFTFTRVRTGTLSWLVGDELLSPVGLFSLWSISTCWQCKFLPFIMDVGRGKSRWRDDGVHRLCATYVLTLFTFRLNPNKLLHAGRTDASAVDE